ncbi:hypothetical protein H4217_001692 [Coemansia sp. RSA 1939]|nr:hypothetical protein H4217_001692 [Coemansia sp. RSA 1939]KAJ2611528.1 hypothetical protein EV177_003445 [Coemansia sp. RSA 1804]KAJ2683109.1 hypothetical protein GGH99_004480 [Coemansia sp. RSA 1285]
MDAVNRRAWLDRAQSSDVVFFNMAFDTAAATSAQSAGLKPTKRAGSAGRDTSGADASDCKSTKGANSSSSGNQARIVDVKTDSDGLASGLRVLCIACTAAPRRIDVGGEYCVVEHAGGALSVVKYGGDAIGGRVVWTHVVLLGDVVCAWWIERGVLGVVSIRGSSGTVLGNGTSGRQRTLVLCVADVRGADDSDRSTGSVAVEEHELCALVETDCSAHGWSGATVIARATHVVCAAALLSDADSSDAELRSWSIVPGTQGRALRVVEAPARALPGSVTALQWTSGTNGSSGGGVCTGLGIGADPKHAFWFSVRESHCSVYVCDVSRNLPPAVAPSWRWHAAVVVVAAAASAVTQLPPNLPVLCLPGPTGMAFYSLDTHKGTKAPASIHRTTFPSGWVWLCGTHSVFVILSPCRQVAAMCRMPLGERIFSISTAGGGVIQDAWAVTDNDNGSCVCAVYVGDMLYCVDFSCFMLHLGPSGHEIKTN